MPKRHTIEAGEKPLADIFCDKYLFSIPPYQRPYAWEVEQARDLLDDVLTAMGDETNVADSTPYFLGSIVLIKEPDFPEADVVDGQQRLTTLTILLCVLRDLAREGEPKIAESIDKRIRQEGDPITGVEDKFRLTLRERDRDVFCEHVQSAGATSSLPDWRAYKDSQQRIIENAAFLRGKILELGPDERRRLVGYLVQRCYLVVVSASDQQSAFRIFSVLNSRGMDLSAADILKADIIGALPDGPKREQYNEIWENTEEELGRARFADLIGHIRMIHRKQKMKGTLVAEFREYVSTAKDPARFIESELEPYADAFAEISEQAFASHAHADEINALLRHLARIDNFDWQPPAVQVIARKRNEPAYVLRFLKDLERLAYGLFILRADASDRIRRYGQILDAFQNGQDLFDSVAPLQLTGDEIRRLREALQGPIYEMKRVRLPLLLRLDTALSDAVATYDHEIISVEHVLPQNPAAGSLWLVAFPDPDKRQLWTHRLANLVLLSRRKNAQASNYDFVKKKTGYFMSRGGVANFALTNQVLAQQEWTPDVLEKRQKELVGVLEKTWRLT